MTRTAEPSARITDAEAAKNIRSELKEMGLGRREISVRCRAGAIYVSIRTPIRRAPVDAVASRHAIVRRCPHTGDILAGGNRFVSVSYASGAMASIVEARGLVDAVGRALASPGRIVDLGDGVGYSVGDNGYHYLWSEGCSTGQTISGHYGSGFAPEDLAPRVARALVNFDRPEPDAAPEPAAASEPAPDADEVGTFDSADAAHRAALSTLRTLDSIPPGARVVLTDALAMMAEGYEAERAERIDAQLDADGLRAELARVRARFAALQGEHNRALALLDEVRGELADARGVAFADSGAVDGSDPWRADPVEPLAGDSTVPEGGEGGGSTGSAQWGAGFAGWGAGSEGGQ